MVGTVTDLPIEQIVTDGTRRDPGAELLWSLQTYGQLEPIVVRAASDGAYELLNGRRRLAAARILRWSTLAGIVEPAGASNPPKDLHAILVNTHRKNLTQLFVARHIRRLLEDHRRTQAELARALRLSEPTISWMLKVLNCQDLVRAVEYEGLEWGAAKALTALSFAARQEVLDQCRAEKRRTGRFPAVRRVAEEVRLRQGRAGLTVVPPGLLPEFFDELLARDVAIVSETVRGRQTQVKVTLVVAEADQDWVNGFHMEAGKGGRAIKER